MQELHTEDDFERLSDCFFRDADEGFLQQQKARFSYFFRQGVISFGAMRKIAENGTSAGSYGLLIANLPASTTCCIPLASRPRLCEPTVEYVLTEPLLQWIILVLHEQLTNVKHGR